MGAYLRNNRYEVRNCIHFIDLKACTVKKCFFEPDTGITDYWNFSLLLTGGRVLRPWLSVRTLLNSKASGRIDNNIYKLEFLNDLGKYAKNPG